MDCKGLKEAGGPSELISWDSVWNDEHPMMGTMIVEELKGQFDEIISIPGH